MTMAWKAGTNECLYRLQRRNKKDAESSMAEGVEKLGGT
jgi:hypothetical protein